MQYIISDYNIERAKQLNLTVKVSKTKNKKLDVFKDNVKIANIGDKRYKDYPTYIKEKGLVFANKRKE